MPTEKPSYLKLCSPGLAAQLEGCIISFFSSSADIELLTDASYMYIPATGRHITVIISFGGIERGFLTLNCTEVLARQIAVSMLGETDELPDSCLCNTLGEVANILTENMLDIAVAKKSRKISVPTFIHNDSTLIKKLLADTRGYTGLFFCRTEQVLIKLVIHPDECGTTNRIDVTTPVATTYQAHQLFSCPRFGKPCKRLQVETAHESGMSCTHSAVTQCQ
jgi:hypothetical protein